MPELSKVQQRTPTRDRPLGRRRAILPERRNQEPNRTEILGDMRSARRGDVGGAEALLNLSRQVNQAGRQFQEYHEEKRLEKERELSQQGVIDEASGNIDEELLKNASYNRAVRLGQARKAVAGVLPEVNGAVKEALNKMDGMSFEERQALLEDTVENVFAGRLLDEEGNVTDFGTAEATVYAANKLTAVRAQVLEQGLESIRTEMDEESIDVAANYVAEAVLDNEVVDWEAAEAHLTAGADREVFKQRVFLTLEKTALADPETSVPMVEKLLADMEEGDGVGLFDEQDQVTLTAILARTEEARDVDREQARQKRYEASAEELFDLYNDGKLNKATIREYRDDDRISGRFARTLFNSLETDERQRRADARAAQAQANDNERLRLQKITARRDRDFAWTVIRARTGAGITSPGGVSDIARGFELRGEEWSLGAGQISTLFSAAQEGAKVRREKPDYVRYSTQLAEDFGMGGGFEDQATPEQKFKAGQALESFESYVLNSEMPPAMAYQRVKQDLGIGRDENEGRSTDDISKRAAELREKAGR